MCSIYIYRMNIIIGAGPSGLQLGYYFEKYNIDYIILEKSLFCGSYYEKYPHSKQLISINKKTDNEDKDYNLRYDMNSLLNDEHFNFTEYSDKYYPDSNDYFNYLNDFKKKNNIKIDFGVEVKKIKYMFNKFIIDTNKNAYVCNKLIIATGLSKPNIPELKNNTEKNDPNIKHYAEYENGYFTKKENLKKLINKNILIIGGGNASYELGNMLNNYASNIIFTGKKRDFSFISHYPGDIKSIYMPLLDTLIQKSQNEINYNDNLILDKNYNIKKCDDINSINYNKYYIENNNNKVLFNAVNNHFDKIIFCTGWKFDDSIFDSSIKLELNNKYPKINSRFESINNNKLYFIGSLMHSIDYRKSSGSDIHGYRYLINYFFRCNYLSIHNPDKIFEFNEENKDYYNDLSLHIYYRINNSSSLFHMFNYLCDIFYYDNISKKIYYFENILNTEINNNHKFVKQRYLFILKLCYGEKNYDIKSVDNLNKFNPTYLHPEIIILLKKKYNYILYDKIILETANNLDKESYLNKINRSIKSLNILF